MANDILAAILSFFIPGLGQALSGEVQKGIVLFILAVIMLLIANFVFRHWIVTIIDLLISLYAAYDAYQINQ